MVHDGTIVSHVLELELVLHIQCSMLEPVPEPVPHALHATATMCLVPYLEPELLLPPPLCVTCWRCNPGLKHVGRSGLGQEVNWRTLI